MCHAMAEGRLPAAQQERDADLNAYLEARCHDGRCLQFELLGRRGCRAKLRLRELRVDDYGQPIGTFETVEGLGYRPLLDRWSVQRTFADKQLLGPASGR